MKTPPPNILATKLAGLLGALLAAALYLLPGTASAQTWLTLANPHWNITLTDAGYSDFLLDNTPGFEGREYLSGEWGAAVGYVRNGQTVAPQWLEPQFLFPDWPTLTTFHTTSPLTQTGLNADNLPIAQSVLANNDLQITLRCEMLDTIVGVPMGVAPASATCAARKLASNSARCATMMSPPMKSRRSLQISAKVGLSSSSSMVRPWTA